MEIEVGEYVRTDSGEIFKVIDIEKGSIKIKSDYREWIGKCCILKHSKNIIDLIEEGDYVNGKKIDAIIDFGIKSVGVPERVLCFEIDFPIEKGLRAYHNCDIKSIVTKEQFKNIEYRLE